MLQIGGVVFLFLTVFGGYVMSGGHFDVILHSLPHEMITIFGAAIAAMLIGNSMGALKSVIGDFAKIITGPKWKTSDYRDLLCLLFLLTKTMKSKGMIALEAHIEKPSESTIFSRFPRISKDHFACDFICDTLRMMTMSLEDPHQVESAMEKQLEKHHHEALMPSNILQNMADGLPALGIVAAVLGVFLAYGLVGPISTRLKGICDEDALFYHVIRDILVAHLHGNSAQVSVEIGRGSVPSSAQPSFAELEEALNNIPAEGAA